jgi:hypothetical protein
MKHPLKEKKIGDISNVSASARNVNLAYVRQLDLTRGIKVVSLKDREPLRLVVEVGTESRSPCEQCALLERFELLRLQLRKALMLATPPGAEKNTEETR